MPDDTLSLAIKEAYASAPSNLVIHHTLEIWHPNFTTPIRVVRDNVDLSAKLESSDDGTTWVDAVAAQAMAAPGTYIMPVIGAKQYRLNNTAFTSGSISATLIFS